MSNSSGDTPRIPAELLTLCGRLRDQVTTEDESRRLSEMLQASREARRFPHVHGLDVRA